MPVGEIVNKQVHKYPSEHVRTEKVVNPDNYSGDKVVSSIPGVTPVGGEMASQDNLHKKFIRQGPAQHYDGDGEDYGKQYKL